MHKYSIKTPLTLHITPTYFNLHRAILREYNWYILAASWTKRVNGWPPKCESPNGLVTNSVELAAKMDQLCSLRMALLGLKHVRVTYSANKVVF